MKISALLPLTLAGLLLALLSGEALAQTGIGTGSTPPDPSSMLEVKSSTKGMLTPRMTTEERDAIATPAQGLVIYNTSLDCFNYYDASHSLWQGMGCEANPGSAEATLSCEGTTIQGTYTQGQSLTGANTITLSLDVSQPGSYNILASANGMTFFGKDEVTDAGINTVVLTGIGTPSVMGATVVVFTFNDTDCAAVLDVQSGVALPTTCGTAGALVGSVTVGNPISGATIPLTGITYTAGTLYSLNTTASNGISIASPTSGNLGTSPASLSIELSGTPVLAGLTTISYAINSKTGCTLTVPVATGTGMASAVVCTGTLAGTYQAGTAMTAANTKVVTLTVTTAGNFNLRTATVDGVYFASGLVTLALGSQAVTLTAVGTPAAPGTYAYPILVSNTAATTVTCSFSVVMIPVPGVPNYTSVTCATPGALYTYLKASNATAGDYFGFRTNLSGDGLTLVVGAHLEDGSGVGTAASDNNLAANAGAAYVYVRASAASVWTFQAYIKASNTNASDNFGYSVALSNDGNTMVVGAWLEDGSGAGINPANNNATLDAGAAYVYTRTGSTWTQQAYIKASNPGASDRFGNYVAMSADGNTVAVGSYGEDGSGVGINPVNNNSTDAAGAAYVFTRSGSIWSQQAYIKASNPGALDRMGLFLELSDDGNTLAVSAPTEDGSGVGINPVNNNSAADAGAVYVYTRSGSTWSQQAYIKAGNTSGADSFGYSLALSANGNTLAVGSYLEDGSGKGINPSDNNGALNAGATYVYTRSGSTWTQQAYIKADNSGTNDYFGYDVALSDDGNTLAVGAVLEDGGTGCVNGADNNILGDAGAAYTFTRTGTAWVQHVYLKAGTPRAGAHFAASVNLSGDGKVLSVGGDREDGSGLGVNPALNAAALDSGGAWVFTGN